MADSTTYLRYLSPTIGMGFMIRKKQDPKYSYIMKLGAGYNIINNKNDSYYPNDISVKIDLGLNKY